MPSMLPRIRCACAALLMAALAPGGTPAASTAHLGPPPLAERRLDFREDTGSDRVIAEVQARLLERDGGVVLEVTASAVGPQVEPPAGFAGRQGGNRITAQEIRGILARRTLRVLTWQDGAPAPWPGAYREGRRGRLPERRILADDRLALEAETESVVALELVAESGPLRAGTYRTEFVVNGVPRLRVEFRVGRRRGWTGEILGLEGLAAGIDVRRDGK